MERGRIRLHRGQEMGLGFGPVAQRVRDAAQDLVGVRRTVAAGVGAGEVARAGQTLARPLGEGDARAEQIDALAGPGTALLDDLGRLVVAVQVDEDTEARALRQCAAGGRVALRGQLGQVVRAAAEQIAQDAPHLVGAHAARKVLEGELQHLLLLAQKVGRLEHEEQRLLAHLGRVARRLLLRLLEHLQRPHEEVGVVLALNRLLHEALARGHARGGALGGQPQIRLRPDVPPLPIALVGDLEVLDAVGDRQLERAAGRE